MEQRKISRGLCSPTGFTPKQIEKRAYVQRSGEQVKGRKSLSFHGSDSSSSSNVASFPCARKWSEQEDKGLVEFILLTTLGDSWPFGKRVDFWNSAALFVH